MIEPWPRLMDETSAGVGRGTSQTRWLSALRRRVYGRPRRGRGQRRTLATGGLEGQLVGDRPRLDAEGPDLFWAWSASKPVIALLVWQLIEAGTVGVDDPVARWWPEFAVNGKQDVTVRHLLQHRSGSADRAGRTARRRGGDGRLALVDPPVGARDTEVAARRTLGLPLSQLRLRPR